MGDEHYGLRVMSMFINQKRTYMNSQFCENREEKSYAFSIRLLNQIMQLIFSKKMSVIEAGQASDHRRPQLLSALRTGKSESCSKFK